MSDERIQSGDETESADGRQAALDDFAPESSAPDSSAPESSAPESNDGDVESIETSEADEPTGDSEPNATDVSSPSAAVNAAQASAEEYEEEPAGPMEWYILKVQSNREDSIADAIQRRVSVAGLDRFFGQIVVPSEKVTEFKGGKKKVVRRKLYPGYILAQMIINDDTWFLVRDTPGVGDFTGAGGKPTPMLEHEVQRILHTQEEKPDEAPKLKINFNVGDRVKINEGTFENFEGEVSAIDEASGRVNVMINIFGRSVPVELEYWQIENV